MQQYSDAADDYHADADADADVDADADADVRTDADANFLDKVIHEDLCACNNIQISA